MQQSKRILFAVGLAVSALLCQSAASAALDMTTGLRYVVPNAAPSTCGDKAKTALSTYLQNPTESGAGEWVANGPIGTASAPTAAATVHCSPVGKGYVVTFTCAVEVPGNPYTAAALCLDVAHKFIGKPVTPLAAGPTPTPPPVCGSTTNLVGTWVSNGGPTFKMDANGDLVDSDGTSGNWALNGNTVTLTYYGNHTLTLSSDGKRISGRDYNLTRKC